LKLALDRLLDVEDPRIEWAERVRDVPLVDRMKVLPKLTGLETMAEADPVSMLVYEEAELQGI
jgi:hypothetical protein